MARPTALERETLDMMIELAQLEQQRDDHQIAADRLDRQAKSLQVELEHSGRQLAYERAARRKP